MRNILRKTMMEMTWKEVEEMAMKKALVLFPVGVVEEHGPHLPLATDIYLALDEAETIQDELNKLGVPSIIAPPYYWGATDAATRQFPGTFNSRRGTVKENIIDILANLENFGFDKAVILNCHGDPAHRESIVDALKEYNENNKLKAKWLTFEDDLKWQGFKGDEDYILALPAMSFEEMFKCDKEPTDNFDIHAGAFETAGMIESFPEFVKQEIIPELPKTDLHGDEIKRWARGEKEDKEVIPQGYCGDPAMSLYIKSDMNKANRIIAAQIKEILNKEI